MPDVVDLNLAYGTMFGKNTRHFTLAVRMHRRSWNRSSVMRM